VGASLAALAAWKIFRVNAKIVALLSRHILKMSVLGDLKEAVSTVMTLTGKYTEPMARLCNWMLGMRLHVN